MSAAVMRCGLVVDVCKIGDVCYLPAPAHQPFSSNSLNLTAPEETYSRNVRASDIVKFGYEGVFFFFFFFFFLAFLYVNAHFSRDTDNEEEKISKPQTTTIQLEMSSKYHMFNFPQNIGWLNARGSLHINNSYCNRCI